jgi:ubiquitin carboxyl-terminal hydrolase 16/45
LASYTFIDQLFGGHLLSSIVCTKCDHCTHKVEPFLDLSLPIIADKQTNSASTSNQSSNAKKNGLKIATEKEDTPKYSRKSRTEKMTADDFKNEEPVYDKKANKISKHQTKKQKKESKKNEHPILRIIQLDFELVIFHDCHR